MKRIIKGKNKNVIVLTSVVLGVLSILVMKMLKLKEVPFINKILEFKNLGVDSLKDFLEISDLNLRREEQMGNIEIVYSGTKLVWNDDESNFYTMIISSDYVTKLQFVNLKNIQEIKIEDINKLVIGSKWIYKISILSNHKSVEPKAYGNSFNFLNIGNHQTESNKHIISCILPLEIFHCRIKSGNGRLSKNLKCPTNDSKLKTKKLLDTWITKDGSNYYLHVKGIKDKNIENLIDYKVVLYNKSGKGLIKNIPKFKTEIKYKLGPLSPCLCYIFAMYNIGTPYEQFVSWIGEDESLSLNSELNKYIY